MNSAVLTRTSKGNNSIFQPVKQADSTTEYTRRADGYWKTQSLHRHFQRKKKFLFGPDFPAVSKKQSHKGGCGFPTAAQAKRAGTFSSKVLFCKGKQNIT